MKEDLIKEIQKEIEIISHRLKYNNYNSVLSQNSDQVTRSNLYIALATLVNK